MSGRLTDPEMDSVVTAGAMAMRPKKEPVLQTTKLVVGYDSEWNAHATTPIGFFATWAAVSPKPGGRRATPRRPWRSALRYPHAISKASRLVGRT